MKRLIHIALALMLSVCVIVLLPLDIFAGTFSPTIQLPQNPGDSPEICSHTDDDSNDICDLCNALLSLDDPESPFICFEHVYDDVCTDKFCNNCGSERSVDGHKYDNYFDIFCGRADCSVVRGDADGSGDLNNADFTLIQNYINGHDVTIKFDAADYDGNGKINNKDLGRIQRKIDNMNSEGSTSPGKPSTGVIGGGVDLMGGNK